MENLYIQLIPYFLKGNDVFKDDKFCYLTKEKVVADLNTVSNNQPLMASMQEIAKSKIIQSICQTELLQGISYQKTLERPQGHRTRIQTAKRDD